jgi:hypothetical protein
MDGLSIKVVTNDDVEKVYSLRPRIIVDFEQKYNKGLAKLIGEEQKLEHIYYLAWLALKHNGNIIKPFGGDFLDTLKEVSLVVDPNSESTETA